jgi:Bacterial extracellular solute-binding protein/von Willebrand factor type A domain
VNAGRASRDAGYRPERKRRASTALLILLAAVLAASLLATLSARVILANVACNDHPAVVHVAVSSEIEPAVQQLAHVFNNQQTSVSGHCAKVVAQAASSASVAAQLSQGTAGSQKTLVDAWIPDSDMWVEAAQQSPAGSHLVHPAGITVAQTPLVIAMPRPVAARTPAFGTSVSWRFLFPQGLGGPPPSLGLHVQFPDPALSAPGLATLIQIRKMFGYGRPARFALAGFVFNVQVVPPTEGSSLPSLAALARSAEEVKSTAPVTITSEQAAVKFDLAHPTEPLAIRYPAEGTYNLTYPYVLTTTDRLKLEAAQAFGTMLRSSYGAAYVRYQGFRSSDGQVGGWPESYGIPQSQPSLMEPPTTGPVSHALGAWQQLSLGSHDLALMDVSAAMAKRPIPGGPTLEQLLTQSAGIGLAQFPDSAQIGLWAFASHLDGTRPYKELISVGPLPAPLGLITRRQQIQRLAIATATQPTGAALYGSILAAYKHMTQTYLPRYRNTVIVMTAGIESDPSDISANTLLRDLRKLYNPEKKVQVVILMLGGAGNFQVLKEIATVTNGQAFAITSPEQVAQIFFHAMGRRICEPHCPGPPRTQPSP